MTAGDAVRWTDSRGSARFAPYLDLVQTKRERDKNRTKPDSEVHEGTRIMKEEGEDRKRGARVTSHRRNEADTVVESQSISLSLMFF